MPPPRKLKSLSVASRRSYTSEVVLRSSSAIKLYSRDAGTASNPIEVGDGDGSHGGMVEMSMIARLEERYKDTERVLAAHRTLNEAMTRKADEELLAKLDLEQRFEQVKEEVEGFEQTIEALDLILADGLLREKTLRGHIDQNAHELESLEREIASLKEQLELVEGLLAQQGTQLSW
ncbi:hypothetical protein JAAARDRAFT_187301 [Jaapia argillacea MUCL 33604]|uniref:Uncharacterized protein n=1 Tax=Jaapia argillacea MUCL 33604 TaxID=933084 RepID=A0A067QAA1_9AGAM|nr:hypothetical protein JAAARDRAFT_187301 [Jaapia argillacea MUCL 33604]